MSILNIERSFCSRTHRIKEWTGKQAGTEGKTAGKVAVPPLLADAIAGWRKYGDADADDPESFIFPTRSGTCIIPTNWAEDVLKPAGKKAGIPDVSYHWFSQGHADGRSRNLESRGKFRGVGRTEERQGEVQMSMARSCFQDPGNGTLCIWAIGSRLCADFVQSASIRLHLHTMCPLGHNVSY